MLGTREAKRRRAAEL